MEIDAKSFWNFVFEIGQLRNVRHEGFRFAGVEQPETVAGHSLRAAQIGYLLACMEGCDDPNEVAAICVFHDMEEVRIGDIQRIASRYVRSDNAQAVTEQVSGLGEAGQKIRHLWEQQELRSTKAGIVAKDADYLDMAAMAKEYLERGYVHAQDWIDNVRGALKTDSAKALLEQMVTVDSHDWWKGLKIINK